MDNRQVGVCLKHLPDAASQPDTVFNNQTVPWQRVINSKGSISPRYDTIMSGERCHPDHSFIVALAEHRDKPQC